MPLRKAASAPILVAATGLRSKTPSSKTMAIKALVVYLRDGRRWFSTSVAQKRGQTPAPLRLKSGFANLVGGQSPVLGKAVFDLYTQSGLRTGQLATPRSSPASSLKGGAVFDSLRPRAVL